MTSTLGKNLNLCFTKIKLLLSSSSPSSPMSPTTSEIPDAQNLSTLMPTSASDSDSDSNSNSSSKILIENFNSLCEYNKAANFDYSTTKFITHSLSSLSTSSEAATVADLSTVFASQRFFFSSPGRSNSIIDQSTSTSTIKIENGPTLFSNSVAVPTFSPDPYVDFRRSMQEMVEAREFLVDVKKSNCEFLHELLLCYLALNPKDTHNFIIEAFVDLLVTLVPTIPDTGGHRETYFSGNIYEVSRASRQCM